MTSELYEVFEKKGFRGEEIPHCLVLQKEGIIALPTIIIISLIVMLIGVGLAGTGFIETLVGLGAYESEQALYIAEAGAQDAYKRLVRNKNCACNYSLAIGVGSVTITVSGTNPKIVRAEGRVRNKRRTIQIILSWNAHDRVAHGGWREVTD